MNSFLIALQFLTRLPVTITEDISEDEQRQSILYYAAVGAVIGLILLFVAWISNGLEEDIAAALVLVVWIGITGALHLDGLSDSADAWIGGYGNKEKTLAIMKDPYCGPAGVVVLVALLILKFTLIAELIDEDMIVALFIAPIVGRFSASWLFQTTPYVREQGLGSAISEVEPGNHYLYTVLLICLLLIWTLGAKAIVSVVLLAGVFYGMRQVMLKRLEGITGDTAGALIEIMEVCALFSFILLI